MGSRASESAARVTALTERVLQRATDGQTVAELPHADLIARLAAEMLANDDADAAEKLVALLQPKADHRVTFAWLAFREGDRPDHEFWAAVGGRPTDLGCWAR